jgi:hypothetical protein
MTMDEHHHHHSNWETSELNNNNNNNYNHNHSLVEFNDVPKFKSVQPPSLPISQSPSFHLPFSSTFSPSDFLISPFFLSSPNVSFLLFHAFLFIKVTIFMTFLIVGCVLFFF